MRTYLRLTHLLDGIQQDHPEVSAPLRLTLLRAPRDGRIGSLDEGSFLAIVADIRPGLRHGLSDAPAGLGVRLVS